MVRRLSLDLQGVVVVVSSRLDSPFVEAGSRSVIVDFPRALGSQVGGRLWGFLPAWEEITYDAFVLSVVREGFFIRYCGTSSSWRPPEPLSDHVPSFSGTLFGRISVPARGGGDRRTSRSPASLFVAGVCDTQALGLLAIDSLFEANQSSFGKVSFPDGSSDIHPSCFESGRRRVFFLDLRDAYFLIPIL